MEIATIDGIVYIVRSIIGDKIKIVDDGSAQHIQDIFNDRRTVPYIRGRLNELIKIVDILEVSSRSGERIVTIEIEKL